MPRFKFCVILIFLWDALLDLIGKYNVNQNQKILFIYKYNESKTANKCILWHVDLILEDLKHSSILPFQVPAV